MVGQAGRKIRAAWRKPFRDKSEVEPLPRLSPQQLGDIHTVAVDKVRALQVADEQAMLIADANVAGLAV